MEFNKLVPELSVSNLQKSLDFYVDVIGFVLEYKREEDKFSFLSFQGSQIMIEEYSEDPVWDTGKLEHPFGRGINFQIDIDDVDSLVNSLKKANYSIKMDIREKWYKKDDKLLGVREILVMDPDGYLLRFSEDIGEKSV
ncbi:MAG: VOC family protein [Candidatus Aenigmarchaeota archaeon]|nr:VOC family protein [Candidatus Aenigmarchaeota archaeon]